MKLNLDDPNYKLEDVIAESKDVLDHVSAMAEGKMFVVNYIIDVVDTLFIYDATTWEVLQVGIKLRDSRVFLISPKFCLRTDCFFFKLTRKHKIRYFKPV